MDVRKPKGIMKILRGISEEAIELHKESGGALTATAEVRIKGKFKVDYNGDVNLVLAGESDIPTEPVAAKASAGWMSKKLKGTNGEIEIHWKLGRSGVAIRPHEDLG